MKKLTNRRGRRYVLQPLDGIDDGDVGYAAAILDEARERCIDQIVDMTDAAMWTRPAGCPFSAGDLVVHMNWAEYVWLPKIGQHRLDEASIRTIERGSLRNLYDPDSWSVPVQELVGLCRETREHLMIPCLAHASGMDQHVPSTLPDGKGPTTVGQILMHVITSWIYHSGQVGLLTMQNGLDYQWAFE
jgi:uncharacterized damage-inducible protein DinB